VSFPTPEPSYPETVPAPRPALEPATEPAPVAAGFPWPGYPGPGAPAAQRRRLGVEAAVALVAAVVVAALGFPLGALWSALAPHAPALMTGDGPVYAQPEAEYLIGAEGWYVFLTLGAGILVAVLAWALLRRYRGALVLLALGLGGAGAGVLAFWYGHRIGLAHAKDLAAHAAPGTHFTLPVNLRVGQYGLWHHWLPYARGDVLLLAIAAVLVYVLLAGFSPYPSLRRPRRPQSWTEPDW
jgi:hypothetical protein